MFSDINDLNADEVLYFYAMSSINNLSKLLILIDFYLIIFICNIKIVRLNFLNKTKVISNLWFKLKLFLLFFNSPSLRCHVIDRCGI